MANILICGFKGGMVSYLKGKIDETIRELNLQRDTITSILEMKCESCDGKKKTAPYLCIRSTEASEIFRIITMLKKNGLRADMEWELIGGFISADEPIEKNFPLECPKCQIELCKIAGVIYSFDGEKSERLELKCPNCDTELEKK